jgi:hypothetical protein
VITVSFLAYPQLIYRTVANAFQTNPSLLGFVKSTGQALAPLGEIGKGLTFALPGMRDFFNGFGGVIKPLAGLDNAGKYLLIQNAAAWISAFVALFYVQLRGRPFQYKRARRA